MSKNRKSAKDLAFERERNKFRSEIRKLQNSLEDEKQRMSELKEVIHEKENILLEKQEWIERLLEYVNLTEEEMRDRVHMEREIFRISGGLVGLEHLYAVFKNDAILAQA